MWPTHRIASTTQPLSIAAPPSPIPVHLRRIFPSACSWPGKANPPTLVPSSPLPPLSTPAKPVPSSRLAPGAPSLPSIAIPNPTQASADLLEALKLTPETPADTLLAANLAEQAGQLDAAAAAYHRVLDKDPKSLPAKTGLAHILIAQKQYPDAETLLRAALVESPGDPTLSAQLATALAAQDKAEALPLLQQLHAAHPADPAITRMLAAVLADAGDYAGSDQLYTGLLAANPSDAALLVAHGQNLVHQALFPQAVAVFTKATQIDAANPDGWSGLAFAASRTGHYDVTLHALDMRSRVQPDNASTLFLWAVAYDGLSQKQQAAAYYHRFLEAAGGKFPNQEWQARQRLQVLGK